MGSQNTEQFTRLESIAHFSTLMNTLTDPDKVKTAKGFTLDFYRELSIDDHVDSCMTSREAGLLKAEYRFTPASDDKSDITVRDFVEEVFSRLDMERIFRDIQDAVYMGYSVLEKVTELQDGKIVYKDVVGRPQEWFKFDGENRLRFLSKNSSLDGELVEMEKVELVQFRASYRNPYGERKYSRIFWPVAFKKGGMSFWVKFLEKYGGALLYIMTDEKSEVKKSEMLSALQDMVQDSVAVFERGGSGDALEAVDVNKSASSSAFRDLIGVCNAAISKVILGQTLTTEQGSVGSQALGKVHQEVRADIIESDKKMVQSVMNNLIRTLVDYNFNVTDYPEFTWFEESEVENDLADRDQKLYAQGVRFTKNYYMKNYGMEEDDFEILENSVESSLELQLENPPSSLPVRRSNQTAAFAEPEETKTAVQADLESEVESQEETFQGFLNRGKDAFLKVFKGLKTKAKRAVKRSKSYAQATQNLLKLMAEKPSKREIATMTTAFRAADILGRMQADKTSTASFAEGDIEDRLENLSTELSRFKPKDYFDMKVPVTKDVFDRLGTKYQHYAFTVSGVASEDDLAEMLSNLRKAEEYGIAFDDWKQEFLSQSSLGLSESRLDLVYRQNMMNAHAAGRYMQGRAMAEAGFTEYWMYSAVMDSGTRPEHAALNGTVRRYDDPFWSEWYPPNGFQCRCTVIALTEEQAKEITGLDNLGDLPSGTPTLDEAVKNNEGNRDFETHFEAGGRMPQTDGSGKLISKPDSGFERSPGVDAYEWLKVKQSGSGSAWKNIITEKLNFNELLKDKEAVNFAPFDYKNGDAVKFMEELVGSEPLIDPLGKPVYFDDIVQFIDHMKKQPTRYELLPLIPELVKNPQLISIDLVEMVGSVKGEKRNKAGLVKLGRVYSMKVNWDGKEKIISLVANSTEENPSVTGWTLYVKEKNNGIVIWQ